MKNCNDPSVAEGEPSLFLNDLNTSPSASIVTSELVICIEPVKLVILYDLPSISIPYLP